jgi:hypothetical protein
LVILSLRGAVNRMASSERPRLLGVTATT